VRRPLLVALIPAHDEEDQMADAVGSLFDQDLPPDLVLACADNCSDDTAGEAERAGGHVSVTVANV
jgi:hypothetical protein